MRYLFLLAVVVLSLYKLAERPTWHSLHGPAMGTTYTVKFSTSPGVDVSVLKRKVEHILSHVDEIFSTYRFDSEISRFNRIKENVSFKLSKEASFLLQQALKIGRQSEGFFDITVGASVEKWGHGAFPGPWPLKVGRQKKGRLILNANTLKKTSSPLHIDLSGIAKGYAVDLLADMLKSQEIAHYLVEIGGELKASRQKSLKDFWRVGIESPHHEGVIRTVVLSDEGMATSGSYRNYRIMEGKKYSHIIDPMTSRPIDHRLVSATVVADTCLLADAWATALMAMGEKKALEMVRRHGLKAWLVTRDGRMVFDPEFSKYHEKGGR